MNSKPPNPNDNSSDPTAARKVVVLPEHDRSFVPTGAKWRGITWVDVPGHDDAIKKLNFALLKRGLLHGHKECAGLHGEELRQRLLDLTERNRDNSLRQHQEALQRRKSRAEKRNRPPPA